MTRKNKDYRSGKGIDVPGATLVFQVTQAMNEYRLLPWQDQVAIAAFSSLGAANTFIDQQQHPNWYKIDRKNLVKLGDHFHVVTATKYKVPIDAVPTAGVALDATGLRASRRQPYKPKE